ncbi:helix-turn-helix domain-containing protein [Embleya sp. NPDC050493]|uniref:helix-turn-helix domain-containing protein n=1 Tax=Embleya sp. NPDC050493 TaxID=3363989 RepID=UPI0037B46D09
MGWTSARFGDELRRRRSEARLSLRSFAETINFSQSHISKVERGLKNPSPELAHVCDAALNAHGELSRLIAPKLPAEPAPPDITSSWAVPWTLHLSPDGGNEFIALDDGPRESSLVKPAVMIWKGPPVAYPGGRCGLSLPHFHHLLDEYRALGQLLGPAVVAQLVVAATNALRGIARSTRGADRDATLALAARFAEYTGWMTQEAGNDVASLWWTDQAATLAEAAGDTELAVYTLIRRAEVALYRGDAYSLLELARGAAARSHSPRIRGLAAQREAQGHALLRDDRACMAALERSRELMAQALAAGDAGGEPALGSVYLARNAAFVSGWCLHDLGRDAAAVRALEGGLDAIPPQALRARARCGARLAVALARSGELERACAIADMVTSSVTIVDSATVRADLHRLNHTLGRWPRDEVARLTVSRIAAAMRVGGYHPQSNT